MKDPKAPIRTAVALLTARCATDDADEFASFVDGIMAGLGDNMTPHDVHYFAGRVVISLASFTKLTLGYLEEAHPGLPQLLLESFGISAASDPDDPDDEQPRPSED